MSIRTTRAKMFRDWKNNFLTVPAFAEHYEIDMFRAELMIQAGRDDHRNKEEVNVTIQKGEIFLDDELEATGKAVVSFSKPYAIITVKGDISMNEAQAAADKWLSKEHPTGHYIVYLGWRGKYEFSLNEGIF